MIQIKNNCFSIFFKNKNKKQIFLLFKQFLNFDMEITQQFLKFDILIICIEQATAF